MFVKRGGFSSRAVPVTNSSPTFYSLWGGGGSSSCSQTRLTLLAKSDHTTVPGDSFFQVLNKQLKGNIAKCFQIHRYLLLILISITFWLFERQLTGLCYFLALIFQHSNTPSYIYLDIGLLKHPQHHFTFIPVALNSELHYYNHLNAPLCNHP